MDKEVLKRESATAQVRIFVSELLSDGKPHTRKEMMEYIRRQASYYGLGQFRDGCLAGGIRQAVINMNCRKLGTGIYQAQIDETEENDNSVSAWAARYCQAAIDNLRMLSKRIDYITATDDEINNLQKLKQCVNDITGWKNKFESMR